MITKQRVKELLQLNLRDERMTSAQLMIHDLIERTPHGSGVEQYRIWDKVNEAWITSLEELIDKIDEDSLVLSYAYEGERLCSDRVTGFNVLLGQYEVRWAGSVQADYHFSGIYDFKDQQAFQFFLVYLNDGDVELPLKIAFTKLVKPYD